MGTLLSRDTAKYEADTQHRPVSTTHVHRPLKRKHPTNNSNPETPTSNAEDGVPQGAADDAEPDGNVHRYIVRCSTIFWSTRKDIVKILSKLEGMPPYGGLHKVSKWDHFFITFPNKKCAEKGIKCMSSYKYRGEQWEVSETSEHSAKRRRIDNTLSRSQQESGAPMPEDSCPSAAEVTAKWREIPYEEQIERKRRKWLNALRQVTKKLRKEVREQGRLRWLDELLEKGGKSPPACCLLKDIVTADVGEGRTYYRNKNEFTIGISPDSCGKQHDFHKSKLTIGYALGLVRDGQVFVGAVDDSCLTTSKTSMEIAQCLAPVIESLNMPAYDKRTHKGYWRQITCREGLRTGQVIVSVVVNPFHTPGSDGAAGVERINDEHCQTAVVKALCEHFESSRQFGVFWQSSNHVSAVSSDIPAVHLYGINGLHEEMCGLTFRIQPTAFFQVNTIMAERLYNLIGDLASVDKNTAILDVCCGTGTIGLSLAKRAHSVVGIEMNESAIEDAEYNAKLNGITNASFIAGKVENKIHDAIKSIDGNQKCVVILDPPRAGLPMNVVAAVRGMRAVQRIVYVACEPNNFWRNALGFCRPRSKAFRLEPFRPVKAYGVDLFPHTDHGELAVLLERDEIEASQ